MTRFLLAAATLACLSMTAAHAADAGAPDPAASSVAKKAPTAAQKRLLANAKSKALATASAPVAAAPLSDGQMAVARRVYTGVADCEFGEHVSVVPVPDHAGEFKVSFKKVSYTMVPEETTTGAVRLVDHKAGGVWLQIPFK